MNFEQLVAKMPYEMQVQHCIDILDLEEQVQELKDQYQISSATDLLKEAKYVLSTYFSNGHNPHINYELKEDEPAKWKEEVREMKKYIKLLESAIAPKKQSKPSKAVEKIYTVSCKECGKKWSRKKRSKLITQPETYRCPCSSKAGSIEYIGMTGGNK